MRKNTKILGLLITLIIYSCNTIPNNINNTNQDNISKISPSSITSKPSLVEHPSKDSTSPTPQLPEQNLISPKPIIFDSEFKVGKTRNSFQGEACTILMDDGSSITSWSAIEDSLINIYAQIYDKELKPIGDEFKVNTININKNEETYFEGMKKLYISPQVVKDNNGFIISWTYNGKIYLRKYDKNAYAEKPEINLRVDIDGYKTILSSSYRDRNIILPNKNGNYFILGGESIPGYGQLYDKDFNPIGGLIKLPAGVGFSYGAIDKQDNILLVFWDYNNLPSVTGLYGQRYDSNLSLVGEKFKIDDISNNSYKVMGFDIDQNGNFVLAGEVRNQEGTNWDIRFQKYSSSNIKLSSDVVNTVPLNFNHQPSTKVSMNDNGDFVITWGEESNNYSKTDIYARAYDKNGLPKGKDFKVNYLTKGFKSKPDVSLNNNGDFLITWSNWNDNQNAYEIYSRKYNINEKLPFDDPNLIPKENINCKPDEAQANEINNQKSYTGDLKVKVYYRNKLIELKSKDDYQNLLDINSSTNLLQVTINGKPYMYNTLGLQFKLKKSGCFDEILSKYGIKSNTLSGYYFSYLNYQKAPIDKFQNLLRKFIIKEKLEVNEIEFSSPQALAAFATYMELKLNYYYIFDYLSFDYFLTLD